MTAERLRIADTEIEQVRTLAKSMIDSADGVDSPIVWKALVGLVVSFLGAHMCRASHPTAVIDLVEAIRDGLDLEDEILIRDSVEVN